MTPILRPLLVSEMSEPKPFRLTTCNSLLPHSKVLLTTAIILLVYGLPRSLFSPLRMLPHYPGATEVSRVEAGKLILLDLVVLDKVDVVYDYYRRRV